MPSSGGCTDRKNESETFLQLECLQGHFPPGDRKEPHWEQCTRTARTQDTALQEVDLKEIVIALFGL